MPRKPHRRSLDEIEREINETRERLTVLLARADRHYGVRPILHALLRSLQPPPEVAAPSSPGQQTRVPPRLGLQTAIVGIAIGLLTAARYFTAKSTAPDEKRPAPQEERGPPPPSA